MFLEDLLANQEANGVTYPIDEAQFQKLITRRVRRQDKAVAVTVPTSHDDEQEDEQPTNDEHPIRESCQIQALLSSLGEKMGFKVWIPRADRSKVLQEWTPTDDSLVDVLPLNYDEATLSTIEQIDVLWLKGRSIRRAFEVEHTTAVYSGILRMADLLALQPNMNIRMHIVAPDSRKNRVFNEILRPVFSLLDGDPLSERCTFLSYDSLHDLASTQHLAHLSDSVLDDYAETAE